MVPMHKFACFEQTIGKLVPQGYSVYLCKKLFFPSGNATYFQAAYYRGAAASIFRGDSRFYSMHCQMSEITVAPIGEAYNYLMKHLGK